MNSIVRRWHARPVIIAQEEWRQFRHWIAAWLLLVNAPFFPMWWIGSPPRTSDIIVVALAGLSVRRAKLPLRLAMFLFMSCYVLIKFVSNMFHLSSRHLVDSMLMLDALNPVASIEYLVAGLGIMAVTVTGVRLLRRDAGFRSPLLVLAALCGTCLLAAVDTAVTWSNRVNYAMDAPTNSKFGSGITNSNLLSAVGERRDILVVVVEALGQPLDDNTARLLAEPWMNARVLDRYEFTQGTSPYFGSTTNGEIRELCGRWGNYGDLLEGRDLGCLPNKLRTAGYATKAYHSFDGEMFRRSTWYPNAGFEDMVFADDLLAKGAQACAGVFPGACDEDVPRFLAAELKRAEKPQFVYWLTVNTHLPLAPRDGRCRNYSAELWKSSPMSCRLFRIYHEVSRKLAAEIIAEDFPPTDILLVGDHMPPFFDRWNRAKFDPQRVPWIRLRHRRSP